MLKRDLSALIFIYTSLFANEKFVDVSKLLPQAHFDIRYSTNNNFVGKPIDGYKSAKCLLTKKASVALANVQKELLKNDLSLKLFDCYRPQHAVDHFVRWAKDIEDRKTKRIYYPNVKKKNLFKDGYIAEKSGHSRGSTLDVTLIRVKTNKELDMGTPFDFFDPLSHTESLMIGKNALQNRLFLKEIMEKHGFKNLKEEWWHFSLKNEPYPKKYFDFEIE